MGPQPNISLGTAQIGLPYGITNTRGKISNYEVKSIFELASSHGVKYIDTAQSYGNAEEIIGKNLPTISSFKIITKLAPQSSKAFTLDDKKNWEESFLNSKRKLGNKSFYGFLIHNIDDLKKPGSKLLLEWLMSLKERNFVKKIGISIYEAKDLTAIPKKFTEIVQMPLSLYDQRLIKDGTIDKLKKEGCEIHARSIFLQGLLLTSASKWPRWISRDSLTHHLKLESFIKRKNKDFLNITIDFIKEQKKIDALVMGFSREEELKAIIKTWEESTHFANEDWEKWALTDIGILDPRRWP